MSSSTSRHLHTQTTCRNRHYGYKGFKLALASTVEAAAHLRSLAEIHSLQLFSASEPRDRQVAYEGNMFGKVA